MFLLRYQLFVGRAVESTEEEGLFGKGKYADMEKENKRLKEELPKQKAAMQRQYQKALDAERKHHTQQLVEKNKQIEDLQGKYKGEVFRHQQDNQEKDRIIRLKDSIINDYRERLGHYQIGRAHV